jgi:branched-chain amino acid transport system permease protein
MREAMVGLQILVDGFAISTLYALGAIGFSLIFGVSGVLNLSHGGIMVIAAIAAWYLAGPLGLGQYAGSAGGVVIGALFALLTYALVVRPIQRSRAIPRDETEIFVLTGTLLWGIMLQEAIAYFFTDSPVTVRPLIGGVVDILGVRTPANEIFTAITCWVAMGLLWLFVNRTRAGKTLMAAAINPRGLTLLGYELGRVYLLVWTIYGVLAAIAGVLLATFLGTSSANVGVLTASAFSIVVLGGLGSISGSLLAAYIIGYLETATAYLVTPVLRTIPSLLLLVLVVYLRPQGLLGRR